MTTSRTTLLASAPPDGDFVFRTRMEPNGHVRKTSMAALQIAPFRASAEVANAIHRQRRTGAVTYSQNYSAPTTNNNHVFSEDFNNGLEPSHPQYIITSPYGSSIQRGHNNIIDTGTNKHGIGKTTDYTSTHNSSPSKSRHFTSPFPSGWTRYSSNGYATVDDKLTKSRGSAPVNSGGSNSKQRDEVSQNGGMKFTTLNIQLSSPDSFNKSSKSGGMNEILNSEAAPTLSSNKSPGYSKLVSHEDSTENKNMHISLYILPSQNISTTDQDPISALTKIDAFKSSTDTLERTRLPRLSNSFINDKSIHSKQDSTDNMPCVRLADSILDAVGSDLNQIYHICKSKIRYSDLIAMSRKDLFPESGAEFSTSETAFSSQHAVPSLPYLLSPSLSSSKVTSSPDSPTNKKLRGISRESSFANSANTVLPIISPKISGLGNITVYESDDEPDIDYDKEVTIIAELDDTSQPDKSRRPILKNGRINSSHGHANTSFDEIMNYDNRKVAAYAELQSSSLTRKNTSTGISSKGTLQILDSEEKSSTEFIQEKGRLVRFSSNNQIYEFAPLEPILSYNEQDI